MVTNINLEFHQCADDTTLVSRFTNQTLNVINTELEKLSQWAGQWGVTFNQNKTHYMLIANKIRPILGHIYTLTTS